MKSKMDSAHLDPFRTLPRPHTEDGHYRVTTKYFCADFVVEHGRVIYCAPILRQRLAYWRTVAERIE